jgi:hypothetical protein
MTFARFEKVGRVFLQSDTIDGLNRKNLDIRKRDYTTYIIE